jgi:hypothetical protein
MLRHYNAIKWKISASKLVLYGYNWLCFTAMNVMLLECCVSYYYSAVCHIITVLYVMVLQCCMSCYYSAVCHMFSQDENIVFFPAVQTVCPVVIHTMSVVSTTFILIVTNQVVQRGNMSSIDRNTLWSECYFTWLHPLVSNGRWFFKIARVFPRILPVHDICLTSHLNSVDNTDLLLCALCRKWIPIMHNASGSVWIFHIRNY